MKAISIIGYTLVCLFFIEAKGNSDILAVFQLLGFVLEIVIEYGDVKKLIFPIVPLSVEAVSIVDLSTILF